MKLKNILLAIVISSGLVSCNKTKENPTIIEEAHTKLIGTWYPNKISIEKSYCIQLLGGARSLKDRITIHNNDIIHDHKSYNNYNCNESGLENHTVTTYEYEVTGTYKLDEAKYGFIKEGFIIESTVTSSTNKVGTVAYTKTIGEEVKSIFTFKKEELIFSSYSTNTNSTSNGPSGFLFNSSSNTWIK